MNKKDKIKALLQEERLLDEAQYKFLDTGIKTVTYLQYEQNTLVRLDKKKWYKGDITSETLTEMCERKNDIRREMNSLEERRTYANESALSQCRLYI